MNINKVKFLEMIKPCMESGLYEVMNDLLNECEDRAGGIASYYTSPLALRAEYEKESSAKAVSVIGNGTSVFVVVDTPYVYWLERKLVRQAGE